MPIDKNFFEFRPYYIGLWSRKEYPNENLSGTLFVDAHQMWLELCFKETDEEFPEELDCLKGQVYAVDDSGNKTDANISAEGLEYVSWSHFGNGLRHYKFNVANIFIYDGELNKEQISRIEIRASILDDWAAPTMIESYPDIPGQLPASHHMIYHILPHRQSLLNSKIVSVGIDYLCSYQFGGINQGVEQRAFLYISPRNKCFYEEALKYVTQFQYLFYILTNRIFPIDYMYCEYGNNTFIPKTNEKLLYRYIEDQTKFKTATTTDDFSDEELQSIFSKWLEIYNDYFSAINIFFETLTNVYTSPASQIRNYISSIDALTKSLVGDEGYALPNTKRAKTLEGIFKRNILTADEKNRLKEWLLHIKGSELKPRISKMLELIAPYIPQDLDKDFAEKIVNSRNNITHPNAEEEFCFGMNEYKKVAYQLSVIIRAYILVMLNVREDVIKKIVLS